MGAAKVNEVSPALNVKLFVPLSCRTSPVPARPEMGPPMVKEAGGVLSEFCVEPPHDERQSATAIKMVNFERNNFMAVSGLQSPLLVSEHQWMGSLLRTQNGAMARKSYMENYTSHAPCKFSCGVSDCLCR